MAVWIFILSGRAVEKTLIIIRGVQGSGKSTLAHMVHDSYGLDHHEGKGRAVEHYEADMFFNGPDGYKWDGAKIGEAHRWCQMKVNEAMKEGKMVIVSNTFVKKEEMKPYLEMATQHGYQVQEIICKGKFKNVHGVDEAKVESKRRQFEF